MTKAKPLADTGIDSRDSGADKINVDTKTKNSIITKKSRLVEAQGQTQQGDR